MGEIGRLFSKILLVAVFVSVFWVVSVGAEVIIADLTEADLEGHMSWGQFLDNCVEGGTPYNSGGYFEDIDLHLIVDTDAETLSGSISGGGSRSANVNLYTQDYSFEGIISGTVKRTYWAGYMWKWVFDADVELVLSFITSYRCNTATPGVYDWISREETVHVTKRLTLDTAADNNKQFMNFRISWVDYDEQYDTPIDFYMTNSHEDEQHRAILPFEMPEPVELSAEIIGPSVIGKNSNVERFSLEVSGEQEGMIENVRWYFYNYDDLYGDYLWFQNFEQSSTDDLVIDSSVLSEWMERVDLLGESGSYGKTLRMQVYVEFEKGEYEWLAVTRRFNYTLTKGEVVEISRYKVSGLGQPMKRMQILAESNNGDYLTTTDDKGYFEIPSTIFDQEEWELTIKFAYEVNEKEYFKMDSINGEGVHLKLGIKNEKIYYAKLVNHLGSQTITLEVGDPDSPAVVLEKYLVIEKGLHTYISIYQHLSEALEFYIEYLGEGWNPNIPLEIALFQNQDRIAYLYQEDKIGIAIGTKHSEHDSTLRPVNREYHEFSHYAMHSIYGFMPGDSPTKDSINHQGYLNPNSGDSYSEGFAHFMSVIINEYYKEKTGESYVPDKCGVMTELDDNIKPWEKLGRGEEWAIAGTLWDLYDNDNHLTKTKQAGTNLMGDIFDKMLIGSDLNHNGALDALEYIYEKKTLVDREHIFQEEYFDHDSNYDEKFDKDELVNVVEYKDTSVEAFIEKTDFDQNGVITFDEVYRYIGSQELEKLSKKFSEEEIKVIEDAFIETFSKKEINKESYLAILNEKMSKIKQDESVSIPFKDIWSILRTPKTSFYEVYQAFIEKYPHQKTEIEEIFKAHGFWQDKNTGNGVRNENEPYRDTNNNGKYDTGETFVDYPINGFSYDEGEVIGPAANYNRLERRSTIEIAGQQIKVENTVPFYTVLVVLYSDEYDISIIPERITEYTVENHDGFIYIPFPPESYEATIYVEPVDVEYTRSLKISAQDFHQNYTEYAQQGYYVEHDFNVIGDIPDPPVNPAFYDFTSEESQTTNTSESDTETPDDPESTGGGIPSFSMTSVVLGVSLLLLSKRKRVEKCRTRVYPTS